MPEPVRISQTMATFSPARSVLSLSLDVFRDHRHHAIGRILPLARVCFRLPPTVFLDRSASGPKWLEEAAIADLIAGTIQIGEHERHFYNSTESESTPRANALGHESVDH